jgi:chromate reductase
MDEVNILGISGSLRAGSLNTALLRAAVKHVPAGIAITVYDGLGDVPPYNGDLDNDEKLPDEVRDLRDRIAASDGVLIMTPEYNYSVPGVLKNALDWASRPPATSCLQHKDIAIAGAAPGNFGTIRGQLALRQVLMATNSRVLQRPELHVFSSHKRFDDAGNLVDERTIAFLQDLLTALAAQIGARHTM